ncbi:sec1 family domain-containing protein 2-like isoform X2 [Convolutriloba macropyga]|uniref:sec1 family domain-containing protein 2-like isoform X2 n=1 Tax=Convolutriloba macropyga TaxID=536237 RepID=UPI003F51C6B5
MKRVSDMEAVFSTNISDILSIFNKNATIVLDAPTAELFHWHVDTTYLLQKFIDIKDFSSFSQINEKSDCVLIVISDVICKVTFNIISDIIKSSRFLKKLDIVTPYSENFHASLPGNQSDKLESFNNIKLQLQSTSNVTRDISIHHVPFHSSFLDEPLCLFITPSFNYFDLCSQLSDSVDIAESASSNILESLAPQIQLGVKKFCGNLWRTMTDMDAQIIPFSVGKVSKIVSEHLTSIPAPKSATNKYAVVFIDRVLDFVAPFQPSEKCFADQLFKSYEELNEGSSDVKVPVNQIILKHVQILGFLASPQNATHQNLFRKLFTGKKKELQNASFRILNEICSRNNIKFAEKPTKANYENVEKILKEIEANRVVLAEHVSVVTLAIAIWLSCNDKSIDEKLKLQKLFNQNFLETERSFASVCDALSPTMGIVSKVLSVEDIFCFIISCFSLCDADESYFPQEKVNKLFAALVKCRVKNKQNRETESIVDPFLKSEDNFMKLIACVSTSRCNLADYNSLFVEEDTNPLYKPLVEQIAEDIFRNDPNKVPNDIVCAAAVTNFKSLIKTGFSYFMPVSKPRPSDYPNIIFFIIGGITPAEVKIIKDTALAYNSSCKVYIGSNRILGHQSGLLKSLHNLVE